MRLVRGVRRRAHLPLSFGTSDVGGAGKGSRMVTIFCATSMDCRGIESSWMLQAYLQR